MKIKKQNMKAGGILTMFTIGVIATIMIFSSIYTIQIDTAEKKPTSWKPLGDYDPGAGASGFMYFGTYPHAANPAVTYASNLTSANFYEYIETTSGEMTGDTPHSTAFDWVLKFRVNTTVGYNSSSSSWEISWVRANLTVDFDFAVDISDAAMTIIEITNTSSYAWYHAYLNNVGAGYQITHNEKFNVTSVSAEGNY